MQSFKILVISDDLYLHNWMDGPCFDWHVDFVSFEESKFIYGLTYDFVLVDLLQKNNLEVGVSLSFFASKYTLAFVYGPANPFYKIMTMNFPGVECFSVEEPFPKEIIVDLIFQRRIQKSEGQWEKLKLTEEFHRYLEAACNCDETVLLLGESGAGKSYYANFIHNHSRRRNGEFKNINASTLTPSMADSLLFGTEKSAYTNAECTEGILRACDGGTFFCDEVGEMLLEVQAKMLTFSDNRIVYSLGSSIGQRIDVRMIFATNRNLAEAVEQGFFRQDFLNRINVMTLHVPPLREHKEDIPILVEDFLQDVGMPSLKIDAVALDRLVECNWRKKNVRGLKDTVHKAAALCSRNKIRIEDLVIDPDEF